MSEGMAGEPPQKLRSRGVSAPRDTTTRSNVGTGLALSKHTKAAVKRAANEDNQRATTTVVSQQSKKRPALTNLTNQSNASGIRSNVASKVQVGVNKSKECGIVEVKHEVSTDRVPSGSSSSMECVLNSKNDDDNVTPGAFYLSTQPWAALEVKKDVQDVEVEAIAALEQETKLNLYISKDTDTCSIQCQPMVYKQEEKESQMYMDIDCCNKDPQICSSYVGDIYSHLRASELKRRPSTGYMEVTQHDINANMRGILVDWLVEVAEEYKLVPDTLYLTVSYIDRFLSAKVVNRQRLQLFGVTCMLIAAKYEEICAPQVEEFCYITDNTYCREEVLEMERHVLGELHFELSGPTTKTFLRRFLRAAQANQKSPSLHLEFLGNYLTELTLAEYDFLKYLPSLVAASAVFLASFSLDPSVQPWNATLQRYSGYPASALRDCVQGIHCLQHNVNKCTLPAIREKYGRHKFKCVSGIWSPEVIPPSFFEDEDCGC